MSARLIRWAVRATLMALGHRLDKPVCRFANETGSDDD